MKRCPTCNQTFDEEWLSFCTQDGTTLIDDAIPAEPPPTIKSPIPATPSSPDEQATLNLPSDSGNASAPVYQPQPIQPAWQPPPPPTYAQPPNKSLATASMVVGIIGVTVGWLCFGPIPGIAAIIMGAVALSQIKKNPDQVTGKQFAMTGVVTGSLTVIFYLGVLVVYVIIAIMGANH